MKKYIIGAALLLTSIGIKGDGIDSQGHHVIWFMDGTSVASSIETQFYDAPHWSIIALCDLDGDHTADVVWWNDETGMTIPWLLQPTGQIKYPVVITAQTEPQWKLKGCADINGDGKADMLWRYEG